MENTHLILFFSVALNVLMLRWAVREYVTRRHIQQEASALQKALRSVGNPGALQKPGAGALGWLLGAAFLAGVLLLALAV